MNITGKTQLEQKTDSWIGRSKILVCGLVSVFMILSASVVWAGCGKKPEPYGTGYALWCRCSGGVTSEIDNDGKLDCKPIDYAEDSTESVVRHHSQMTIQKDEKRGEGGE